MTYGLARSNLQRPVVDHPSLGVLRAKNIGVVSRHDGSYLVAGTIVYTPKTDFWKLDEHHFGYGVDKLIAAVLPGVVE